ncbi:hypothetical protein DYBT9275_02938 [Dyadobacter sp. CECT 9275]|uniref:DUF3298 domain-containing protein n=1 Tax=Dyadobacter helix TaxID=2822344 RepID=A0A916JCN1_9BACT|nr:DUF3298 and DUF4163 domain-containing protein [Dyadobacter sp. CECT 9275]CAG5002655.1 hypothetical protein DYBT9275_02938 [Dyadobacter sp. CECT 9275]
MRIWIVGVVAGVGLLMFGCGQSTEKEEAKLFSGFKKGKIQRESYGSCDTTSNAGAQVRIDIWEAEDTIAAARKINTQIAAKIIDRINSHADSASIAETPAAMKSVKGAFEVFDKNYRDFKRDFPDAPGCWEVEVTGDTVMVTPKLLLYKLDHYAFTGGAHPNTFRSNHVFDAVEGSELNILSFVSDTISLLEKVEKKFREVEKIGENANLEEAGYFLVNHKFFLPANFTFTRTGVLFYYNPYEIAAYARGPIEFLIPYAELDGVVKKDLIF